MYASCKAPQDASIYSPVNIKLDAPWNPVFSGADENDGDGDENDGQHVDADADDHNADELT